MTVQSKFAGVTKLGGVTDTLGACASVQRGLSRLEDREESMKFNKGKAPSPASGEE